MFLIQGLGRAAGCLTVGSNLMMLNYIEPNRAPSTYESLAGLLGLISRFSLALLNFFQEKSRHGMDHLQRGSAS